MLNKDECINSLKSKGFSMDEILDKMTVMVSNMTSVIIGKYRLQCMYNNDSKIPWNWDGGNSKELDDYIYDIWNK